MHKLRTETRNRSSYNPKSDEPSASLAQGVQLLPNGAVGVQVNLARQHQAKVQSRCNTD